MDIERYLRDLEFLINTDSGSMNIEGNKLIADFFARRLLALGYECEVRAVGETGRPLLIASTPGRTHYDYFLCGHMDTVFPDGEAARRPFTRDGNIVTGPGTVDMKAGDLLILYLAEWLIKERPEIGIKIGLVSDEEIGSGESKMTLRDEAYVCDYIFVFEGRRKQGQFVVERKGISKFRVEVEGVAAHAGTAPRRGASAIVELAHFIAAVDGAKDLSKGTSVNFAKLQADNALNITSDKASVIFEMRYRHMEECTRMMELIDELQANPHDPRTKVKVRRTSHCDPLTITPKTKAMKARLEDVGITYLNAGGISDANRLAILDIPILDGCGPGGGNPHRSDEFLDVTTVTERYDLMQRIFDRLKED